MSVRTFIVFQDSPVEHQDVIHPPSDTAATLLSTLAAIEKENLHPVTGQRAGPTAGSDSKKRKTGALATKVLVPPSAKKHKELKPAQNKSRKPLGSTTQHKNSLARKSGSKSSRSRKPSPLPPVAEEHELRRQPARLSVPQLSIDSRCYELTVSPLADVSDAYDASRDSQESDVLSEREKSVEPAIRDYYSPSIAEKPLETMDSSYVNDFSTPQPKHIYSPFTFSSPSPTSERFRQVQSSPTPSDTPASNSE